MGSLKNFISAEYQSGRQRGRWGGGIKNDAAWRAQLHMTLDIVKYNEYKINAFDILLE